MPRFFFHLYDRSGFVEDEEGVEAPDLEAAGAVALKGARSIISHDVEQGRLDLEGRIEVFDAAGVLVLVLPFREAAG
ncbi:MAG: hypothetical protein JWO33_2872 [Caulobacteraceae bacterium]|nr:hypothetical protein [Caulobacteraceae bacterium]